ncbi:serine hydrolase [Algoriphagus halophytocola]|uniref:Beta-lactamase family protein n=1 Tax=Algoriphagus halophytocola TaxID=2991499 RepID=A0ABY6MIK4_9BACT|nr:MULTISPECIES: serine hydrolase domain-containing protein [unclassified Algoriphagus]UZD22814.1 beta-lactamase family protein [Algoriphagus sp. TR-M5]WBL44079.1 serine hydrolase [Algoriphagus sp. TR-M9]
MKKLSVFNTYQKPGESEVKYWHFSLGLKMTCLLGLCLFLYSCAEAQKPTAAELYFPPNESVEWEQVSLQDLDWDETKLEELLAWLPSQGTRAFMILKDGKIVVEEYWGEKLTGLGEMDQDAFWYWASAGKTLTAVLLGIAEEHKLLKRKDRTQDYLGKGWTSLSEEQEREIRLEHHLSMTTGLNDAVADPDDTSAEALTFLAEPGSRWAYHNAPYTLLEKVLEEASGETFQEFFRASVGNKIGMKGFWQQTGNNNVFYSDARSMARFGLLLHADGNWNGDQIWSNKFFQEMRETSQDLNPSYGYLTWLNGKSSFMIPQSQRLFPGMLIPSAPADMYQAMGKNGQFLMVVPSEGLVIVRMGGAGDNALVPFLLIRDIWDRLAAVIE